MPFTLKLWLRRRSLIAFVKRPSHIMKKWTLLLVMSLTALIMVGLPGMVDSKSKRTAVANYRDTPNQATRKEVDDAKKADLRSVLPFEIGLGVLLCTVIFIYARSEKQFA